MYVYPGNSTGTVYLTSMMMRSLGRTISTSSAVTGRLLLAALSRMVLRITASLRVRVDGPRAGAEVSLFIQNEAMAPVICIPMNDVDSLPLRLPPGEYSLVTPLGNLDLNGGKYSFVVSISDAQSSISLTRVQGLRPFRTFSHRTRWGSIVRSAIPQVISSSPQSHP